MPTHTHTASTDKKGAHTHGGSTAADNASHSHDILTMTGANQFVADGRTNRYAYEKTTGTVTTTAALANHKHRINSDGDHTHSVTIDSAGKGTDVILTNPFVAVNYIIKF
jgi:hypothetical protein